LVVIGGVSAFVAVALTLVWLTLMVKSTGKEELAFIAANDRAQVAKFLPTTLVAIAYVPTWLGLGVLLWEEASAPATLAVVLYPAITGVGYWMQYTVVRGLAEPAATDEISARAAYEVVGFHDRPTSQSASVVILGYTVWSFAGLAAGIALVTHNGGLAVTTGIFGHRDVDVRRSCRLRRPQPASREGGPPFWSHVARCHPCDGVLLISQV
jgi:hypothetical protein